MAQKEEQSSDEDKTEDPTEERRSKFREEGQIANPREILGGAAMVVFCLFFYFNAKVLLERLGSVFHRAWSGLKPSEVTADSLWLIIYYIAKPIIPYVSLLFISSVMVPLLFGFFITRFNFSFKKITLNFAKLNPMPGVQKIFSTKSIIECTKILFKFTVLSVVVFFLIKKSILKSVGFYFVQNSVFLRYMGQDLFRLLLFMCVVFIVLGVFEYVLGLLKIEKELKMTKKEVKDDVKSQEGDPQLKSRRRRMAKDLIFRKSLKDVPKATFIVTNPEHFAIAIRYFKGMNAPIIVAKGQDFMALKIREIAKKNDIAIVENKPLARTLFRVVKIGQEIPPSFYQSIIEVMKYIYRIRGRNYFDKFMLNQVDRKG